MRYFYLVPICCFFFSVSTHAQGESSLKINETKTTTSELSKEKKYETDTEITDIKLKAESGSRSKYSLKARLSYYGPPLGYPLSKDQPNPDNSPANKKTTLSGSLGWRYRMDQKSTLNFGTGISALTPLHGAERYDVNTPYLSYDHTAKVGIFEMKTGTGISVTTTPNYRDLGQVGSLSFDESLVYHFESSKLGLGLESSLGLFFYDRSFNPKTDKKNPSSYYVGLYPFVKYKFTDKFNFRSSVAFGYTNLREYGKYDRLKNNTVSQRVGVGYSFSPEVYIAPYLDFYPKNITADTVTVSCETIFSVF